jgi:hypothetical protein
VSEPPAGDPTEVAGDDGVPSVVLLGPAPPRPRRRRYVVVGALTLAVMLVSGAAAVPMLADAGTRRGEATGLGPVRAYADLSVDHTDGEVDYPTTPPVGGPHDPVWLECGAYDVPVRDENAVHDLEHGAVWISYDPGLDRAQVRRLRDLLPQNGIMAPYPGLPAAVVITAWGRQLSLDGPDEGRLRTFIADFGHGETAPEPGASCAGGTRDPEGGHGNEGTPV